MDDPIWFLVFLGGLKIALDIWRNKLMADNNTALAAITTAVTDASNAIKDLASKVNTTPPADISAQLTTLAENLEAAVTAAGEPTTPAA